MGILEFFQSLHHPVLDLIFEGVTILGETSFYIVVFAVVYWCINKNYGYRLGFAVITSAAVNGALKEIFNAPRPIGVEGIRSLRTHTATGHSFPSGHTQGASSFWTSIMLQVRKPWVTLLSCCLIVLVGASRLYLGVHWPKDVFFGIIFGVLWVFVSNKIFDMVDQEKKFYMFYVVLIPAIIGMFFFDYKDYFKIVGVLFSLVLGYRIESTMIQFSVKSTLLGQIAKFVLGMVVSVVILLGMDYVLPEWLISSSIKYFVLGLWMVAGAPYVFKKLNLEKETERPLLADE